MRYANGHGGESAEGSTLVFERSAVRSVEADAVQLELAAAQRLQATQASVERSAVMLTSGQRVTLRRSAAMAVVGQSVACDEVHTAILAAPVVRGDVHTLIDLRSAVAIGVGMALGRALLAGGRALVRRATR